MRPFDPSLVPPPPADCPPFPRLPVGQIVDLEIGAGAGWHAMQYARQNPERFLIAIERTSKAKRMLRRQARHPGLKNLLTIRADGINWVSHHVPAHRLDRIFLLYPNPYPKNRQRNLRWVNMPFMGFLLSRLTANGELVLASNCQWYVSEAADQLASTWHCVDIRTEAIPPSAVPRTHFEKKYLARAETCWNLTARVSSQIDTWRPASPGSA